MFDFHVHNGTHKVAPFACSTAAILWKDGPEGSQIGSQRAGIGPPDTAQVAPRLRGDISAEDAAASCGGVGAIAKEGGVVDAKGDNIVDPIRPRYRCMTWKSVCHVWVSLGIQSLGIP